jgi:molybdenum cofactor biosynthesis protein B
MGTAEHRHRAPKHLRIGIISVSSTRSLQNDESGHWIRRRAGKEGHAVVAHVVLPDDVEAIRRTIRKLLADHRPHAVVLTGGTGITSGDVTIEAVQPMLDKELSAFGPLFAQLSFEAVDTAALLSRAHAGIVARTLVFCLPGSLKACQLGCRELVFPELGHLVKHALE